MKNEKIIVLDFGGQYNQLIARRVRECNVYCEIYSYKTDLEKIKEMQPRESSLLADLIALMKQILLPIQEKFSIWEFRFWASVMELS